MSQGDFGHFRENNRIILSKVAKIALKIVFKLKLFPYKIARQVVMLHVLIDPALRESLRLRAQKI